MNKSVAIFDIDGTIFRSSLTIELFQQLIKEKVFGTGLFKKIEKSERKWLNRQGHYDDYIWDVVKAYYQALVGKKRRQVVTASRHVVKEQKFRTYRFTMNLVKRIRNKYFTIGISGSPLEVVKEYNRFLKFDKVYGTEFGVDETGRYTKVVLHEPPRYKKELILRYVRNHNLSLKHSLGVGDTESDIGFLEIVDQPIAFNPNTVLARMARSRKWPVVIERKDLVVKFFPGDVKFLKV